MKTYQDKNMVESLRSVLRRGFSSSQQRGGVLGSVDEFSSSADSKIHT